MQGNDFHTLLQLSSGGVNGWSYPGHKQCGIPTNDMLKPDVAISQHIYFNQLFPMGVEAIVESIALIKKGEAPETHQDESLATYEPPCDDSVAEIDWQKPATELYDLIRGCDPQPGAFVVHQGEKIRFYGTRFIEAAADQPPGTVVEIDDQGLHVAISGAKLIV